MSYFSGQGKVSVAPILPSGLPGVFRWVGNVPNFTPSFDTSKLEHKDSYTGQRLLDKVITTENNSKVQMELEDWSPKNLALSVRGESSTIASGSVSGSGDTSPLAIAVGDIWALKHQRVSAVIITDSAGSPVTVTNTKYTVDPVFGTVVFNDITGYTLPFKAAYTYAATEAVAFFTQPIQEVAVRFEGVNTADNNAPVLVEIYRIALDPTKELGLISNDFGKFTLEGSALIDPTKTNDLTFGQFGRLVYL